MENKQEINNFNHIETNGKNGRKKICNMFAPETYHFYGKKDETRIRRFNFNNTREKAKKEKRQAAEIEQEKKGKPYE